MSRMPFDTVDDERAPATPRARRRLRTAEETRERRRRSLTLGLSLALCALLVNSIVGENGYLATVRYRAERAELATVVARLRRENQALQAEGRRLVEDPAALEAEARGSLGLIRPGETLLIVRSALPAPGQSTSR
jgi:cell division protein FtsB